MLVSLIKVLFFHVILDLSHFVEHISSKISGVIRKDVSVFIRFRQVSEGNSLSESMSMNLHVFLLDVITQHIW